VTGVADTAIATLQRCLVALSSKSLSDPDRARAIELATVALELVDVAARRRVSVDKQAAVVARLEQQYADLAPAERCRRICRQLGIGRSTYYRLRTRQSQYGGTSTAEDKLDP
jgi:hypothetical protein